MTARRAAGGLIFAGLFAFIVAAQVIDNGWSGAAYWFVGCVLVLGLTLLGLWLLSSDPLPRPPMWGTASTNTLVIARARVSRDYRRGLLDAAAVCRAQGSTPGSVPCPSSMAAIYLERMARGETP